MDNITKWMVRGACGAVVLSTGFSFGYGIYAVIRGKQLMHEIAVAKAIATSSDTCDEENFRYSYPSGSPKLEQAMKLCLKDEGNSVAPWWTFKSPIELFLFP